MKPHKPIQALIQDIKDLFKACNIPLTNRVESRPKIHEKQFIFSFPTDLPVNHLQPQVRHLAALHGAWACWHFNEVAASNHLFLTIPRK